MKVTLMKVMLKLRETVPGYVIYFPSKIFEILLLLSGFESFTPFKTALIH